jgi:Uncharacterized protein conserved in bacteria
LIDGLVEVIKRIAENEVKKLHLLELGIVTSVFPHSTDQDNDNYQCNVRLKDKEVEIRKVSVATQQIGLTNVVHVGDLVLVSFINGDINSPVIIGRLYNDEDRPPQNKEEEIVYKPSYGKNVDLRRLNIVLPGGVDVTVNDDKIKVIVGQASIVAYANGDIAISSVDNGGNSNKSSITLNKTGDIDVVAEVSNNISQVRLNDSGISLTTDFDIRVKSKGSINLECELGDLTIKAPNINLESKLSGKLKAGASLDIESDALANIKSTGPMTIKGLPVSIN